jgi:hypothetical protein
MAHFGGKDDHKVQAGNFGLGRPSGGCLLSVAYPSDEQQGPDLSAVRSSSRNLCHGPQPCIADLVRQTSESRQLCLANYRGRFKVLSGQLHFDPAKPEASTLEALIDVRSVQTPHTGADKSFDEEIAGTMILDAAKFPTIRFKSPRWS